MVTSMTAAVLIQAFSDYQAGRGFSPRTIKRRRITLSRWATFLAPAALDQANHLLVEEFVHAQATPATRKAYLSDLRAFYRWAVRRDLLAVDPTVKVDPIKVPRTLPRPIDAALIPSLVDGAPSWRLAVCVALAAYAGLRVSEISALQWQDVSPNTHPPTVTVRAGKGGKDAAIPMHARLVGLLTPPKASGPVVGWSTDRVMRGIRDYLHAAGVPATAHQLRHTAGTEWARITNGNLLIVGRLMRHEALQTTLGYTKLVGADLASVVDEMFGTPLAVVA